jgi:hypothetical protein
LLLSISATVALAQSEDSKVITIPFEVKHKYELMGLEEEDLDAVEL